MPGERRSGPRVPFDQAVLVYAAARTLACRGQDLSVSGILVRPPARARPGLKMQLRFALPGVVDALELEGVLVREARIGDRGYGWGVRFDEMAPRSVALLQRFVRQTLAGSSPSPATASRPSTGPGLPRVGAATDDGRRPRPATRSYPGAAKSYPVLGKDSSSAPGAAKSYPVLGKDSSSAPGAAQSYPVPGKDSSSAPGAAQSYPVPGKRSSTGRSASVDLSHEAADWAQEQGPAAKSAGSSPRLRRQATAEGLGAPRPTPRKEPPSLAGASASAAERTWPGLGGESRPAVGRQALTGDEEELVEYQVDQPSDPFGDLPAARCDDVAETDPSTGRVGRRGRAKRPKRREERWDDTSSVRQLYREAVDEIAGDRLKDKRGRKKSWFR